MNWAGSSGVKTPQTHAASRSGTDHRSITILGATGSVGGSTVDLLLRDKDRFTVEAVTAQQNVSDLAQKAKALGARLAVIGNPQHYSALKEALAGTNIAAAAGPEAIVEAASRPSDLVMASIMGAAGLAPTLAAIERGAIIGLANKECLVCAGDYVMAHAARYGATLVPVDSEHSAIYQVFDADRRDSVEKIILTASGGPFRERSLMDMQSVTPAQAVAHPNWSMGVKISIDSATMMNKGLELIEACHLFDLPESQVDILVHPQSIVHSLVSYIDGSVLAQLGVPDMRTPIAYALAWPNRMAAPCQRLDLAGIGQLTFFAPDPERFPALTLARTALRMGDGATTVLNAANEVAVGAFLAGKAGFLEIAAIVEEVLNGLNLPRIHGLEDVLALDQSSRRYAEQVINQRSRQ